jgi:pantetheine-phosphate adenylyltransferase
MTAVMYPGSFDPITNGHLEAITKASQIFDQVYVVVMTNTAKKYLFTAQERQELITDAVKNLTNVSVLARPASLTVEIARQLQVKTIIRGVRNAADFRYEQEIAAMNHSLAPEIHTLLLMTGPKNTFVHSSMIKEIAHFGGDISKFLPKLAAQKLGERLKQDE